MQVIEMKFINKITVNGFVFVVNKMKSYTSMCNTCIWFNYKTSMNITTIIWTGGSFCIYRCDVKGHISLTLLFDMTFRCR